MSFFSFFFQWGNKLQQRKHYSRLVHTHRSLLLYGECEKVYTLAQWQRTDVRTSLRLPFKCMSGMLGYCEYDTRSLKKIDTILLCLVNFNKMLYCVLEIHCCMCFLGYVAERTILVL